MTGSFPLTIETPDSIALQVLNVMFLRPAARTAADLPRAGEQGDGGRHRTRRALLPEARRRFGRARRQRRPSLVRSCAASDSAGSKRSRSRTSILLTPDFKKAGGAGGAGRSGARRSAPIRPGPALVFASYREPQRPVVAEEGAKAQGAARQRDRGEGRPGDAAGHQEHQGGDGRDDDLAGRTREVPSRPRRRPTCSIPIACASKRRAAGRADPGLRRQARLGSRSLAAFTTCPKSALRDMAASLKRDTVTALLAAERGELRARLLPDVKDADGTLRHALELSSPTLEPLVLYVDPRTGLIAKQAYVVRAPGQPLVEELFSDYRPVDGVDRRVHGRSARRRQAGRRAPARTTSRSTPRSIPDCSRAPDVLEAARLTDFVRRAVRRSVRGRAHARAARDRSGDSRQRARPDRSSRPREAPSSRTIAAWR